MENYLALKWSVEQLKFQNIKNKHDRGAQRLLLIIHVMSNNDRSPTIQTGELEMEIRQLIDYVDFDAEKESLKRRYINCELSTMEFAERFEAVIVQQCMAAVRNKTSWSCLFILITCDDSMITD